MTKPPSRFGSLAAAMRDGTAETKPAAAVDAAQHGAGVHKPTAALASMGETLRDRISRLEADLEKTSSENMTLNAELERARALRRKVGDDIEEFLFLDTDAVADRLPKDRLRGGFDGPDFDALLADIDKNGQNDAITVRRSDGGGFEIAAGRRRLQACRRLNRQVLARVRELDDQAMLCIQYSENERRADISALERARWFADVKDRLSIPAKDIAGTFDITPSTFSLYLRLARFPDEILERLDEPRRLAVIPARRVMEAIESDAAALPRILGALDAYRKSKSGEDPDSFAAGQIDVLLRAAEGRGDSPARLRSAVPERKHIVDRGRRIGTLTRNGGQWVFRFATSLSDSDVQALTQRLGLPIADGGILTEETGTSPGRLPDDHAGAFT